MSAQHKRKVNKKCKKHKVECTASTVKIAPQFNISDRIRDHSDIYVGLLGVSTQTAA